MGDDLPEDPGCGVCGEAKDTNCGICDMALCSSHAQEHSHGPKPQLANTPKPNLPAPEIAAGKSVTFREDVSDDDVLIVASPSLVEGALDSTEAALFPIAKIHDGLDLVDTRNK
jgi:hypothetical protein